VEIFLRAPKSATAPTHLVVALMMLVSVVAQRLVSVVAQRLVVAEVERLVVAEVERLVVAEVVDRLAAVEGPLKSA
jgi:hypothetical protein